MEVQFRHLRPSTLARRVAPGQTESESGQSFLEIVESVTGAHSPLEENPTSGGKRGPVSKLHEKTAKSGLAGEGAELAQEKGTSSQPDEEIAAAESPKGIRIDMTA